MTPTERLNSGVIRYLYKGYSNPNATPEQRLAAVLAPLAADTKYVEHAPPQRMKWGGTHHGVEGWQSFLTAISAELEHEEFVCEGLVAHGPWVFSWGRVATRCRQSGKRSRTQWQHRIRMRRGKIVECHEFYDTLGTAIDLGRV